MLKKWKNIGAMKGKGGWLSLASKAVAVAASVALCAVQLPVSFATGGASSTAGTEESSLASVEVSLELGHAYIQYEGQTVAAPSTAITVPEGKELVFSAEADTNYSLQSVNVSVSGAHATLSKSADGSYHVAAEYVKPGLGIALVTTQNSSSSSSSSIDIAKDSSSGILGASTSASTSASKSVYTYEDDEIAVTATLSDPAAVSDSAQIVVTPVTADSKDSAGKQIYDYEAYINALNESVSKGSSVVYSSTNTLLYDVAFMLDGVEVEPSSGSVKIEMSFKKGQLTNSINAHESDDVAIIHLPLAKNVRSSVNSTAEATHVSVQDIVVEEPKSENVTVGVSQKIDLALDQLSVIAASTAQSTSSTSAKSKNESKNDQDTSSVLTVQDTDGVTFAKEGDIITSSDGFVYQIRTLNKSTNARLIDYTGSKTEVVIPSSVIDPDNPSLEYPVIGLDRKIEGNYYTGSGPFANNTSITSVTIPEGVTYIDYAFEGCSSLKSVSLPSTLLSVGLYAFEGCTSLETLELPSSVKTISGYAFANCTSLRSITGGANVDTIEGFAFCYYGKVDGKSTWIYDSALTSIGDIDLSKAVQIGSYAFCGCTNLHFSKDDSLTLSNAYVQLGSYAFYFCKTLKSLKVDGYCSSVGKYAFGSCTSLKSVDIQGDVSSIGDAAFYKCTALDTVTIGANVETIGNYAFETTDPSTVTIGSAGGSKLKSIGYYAFYDTQIAGYKGSTITIFKSNVDDVTFGAGWTDDKDRVVYPSNKISSADDALTLQEAIDYAADHKENSSISYSADGKATITVSQSVMLDEKVSVPKSATSKSADITLVSKAGNPVIIGQSASMSGGMITVSKDSKLTLAGDITLDACGYSNSVVNVSSGGSFVMNKGTITGVKGTSGVTCGVLVGNGGGGSFVMNGGSITGNTSAICAGGVYIGNGDSFEMNGGSISNNTGKLGGGVMLYGQQNDTESDMAIFTMNGGSITGNTTTGNSGAINADNGGGGVFVNQNALFTMNGGLIDGNSTPGMGGGVATAGWKNGSSIKGGSFVMNGGTISNNYAASCGGGVYSYSQNTVELWAGTISGNTADRWGGGIYTSTEPYTVKLGPTVIYNNTATSIGGGIWLCPEGMASDGDYGSASSENGILNPGIGGTRMAVFDNSAQRAGDDLALMAYYPNSYMNTNGTNFPYAVGNSQLGGGAVTWYQDGGIQKSSSYYDTGIVSGEARYDSNAPIAVSKISTDQQSYALKADVNDASRALATGSAKLVITGNTARQGGGIGGNGDFILPNDGTTNISVTKTWEGDVESARPESILVNLVAKNSSGKETVVANAVLNAACKWSYTWEDLSDEYSYDVREAQVPSGYSSSTSSSYDTDRDITSFSITNAKLGPSELTVKKAVDGAAPSADQVFTFRLKAFTDSTFTTLNKTVQDKTVTNDGDTATFTFGDLTKAGTYYFKLSEDVKSGYAINNTYYYVKVDVQDLGGSRIANVVVYSDREMTKQVDQDSVLYENTTRSDEPLYPSNPEKESPTVSKTATNLDEDFESEVTLSIPGKNSNAVYDFVFVVDVSMSESAEAVDLLNRYVAAADAADSDIRVGIVYFYKCAKIGRSLDGDTGYVLGSAKESGTNLSAGILLGKEMLDQDTVVTNPDNKYLIVLSDGDAHVYQKDNKLNFTGTYTGSNVGSGKTKGETVVTQVFDNGAPFAGPASYSYKYFGNGKEPESFKAPDDWNSYFNLVKQEIDADGDSYEIAWNYVNNRYTYATSAIPEDEVSHHAVSSDKAFYYSLVNYRAAQQAGYHCFASYVYGGTYSRTEEYGKSFMSYLNGGQTLNLNDLDNELAIVSDGSYVQDIMGSGTDNFGNPYNMDFVNDIEKTDLVFNGETLEKRKNADGSFSFGKKTNGSFKELFKVTYTQTRDKNGVENENDSFRWDINTPIHAYDSVQLVYTVKLYDPQTRAGTYGVYDEDGSEKYESLQTNTSAILYPPDAPPVEFPKPTVDYTFNSVAFQAAFSKYYYGSGSPSFTFTMTAADERWKARSGEQYAYSANDAVYDDGSAFYIKVANGTYDESGYASIVFPDISYSKAGTYRYLVTEDASSGYATDPVVYRVTVEVSDSLSIRTSYEMVYDGVTSSVEASDLAFYNNETVSLSSVGLSAMSFGSGLGYANAALPLMRGGTDIELYKVSREGGEGLEDCTYALWMANDSGADVLIAEAKTDATGLMVFKDVALVEGARYYFKEVEAPAGHKVDPYRTAYFTAVYDSASGEVALALVEKTEDGLHAAADGGERS